MAQEIISSKIATGKTVSELLENIGNARRQGWVSAGPPVVKQHHLTQTMIKLEKWQP